MAKAKGKRPQTAAQKRAQADFRAFREDHGRGPMPGESIKGYAASRGSSGSRKPSKRGKRSKPKPLLVRAFRKAKRTAKKHPLLTLSGLGGVGLAAHPKTRPAVKAGVLVVRSKVPLLR